MNYSYRQVVILQSITKSVGGICDSRVGYITDEGSLST